MLYPVNIKETSKSLHKFSRNKNSSSINVDSRLCNWRMTSGHPAHKPAELFRADLISAMKLPDSTPMEPGSFLTIREPWRTEWEKGVQVCVSPDSMPKPRARQISDSPAPVDDFSLPPTRFSEEDDDTGYVMYDLDDLDINWLESVNQKRKFRALAGPQGLSEETLREAILTLETKCQQDMTCAVATEEALGIEYDEQTVCDVCRDPESEEHNDLIFCDKCNVCVHQACYGIHTVPRGEWWCKACLSGETTPDCLLCPNRGGALKRVRPGNTNWAHLSCSLWIPEVRLGNIEKMEPITNIEAIPLTRKNLVCCLCRKKHGACIQCSHMSCHAAYHVTCGFQHNLLMQTKLDSANTGAVIHESYCLKHTALRRSPSRNHLLSSPHKNDMANRPTQLVQVQESFHKYASPDDLDKEMKLAPKLSALIYNYWKLKRKSQHNKPLLSHLPIETSLESIKAELAMSGGGANIGIDMDEYFMRIVHLRQNLEKARNLVYMVQRRERLKKQLLRMQLECIELQGTEILKSSTSSDIGCSTSGDVHVYAMAGGAEEEREELESLEDDDDEICSPPSVRQTRSMTKSINVLDSPSLFYRMDSESSNSSIVSGYVGDLPPSSAGVIKMNGPTHREEMSNHRPHLAASSAETVSSHERGGAIMSTSSSSTIKDVYQGNPTLSCSIPALTNIPLSRHFRTRDLGLGGGGPKNGRQNNCELPAVSAATTVSSSFHVSFHGLGKDSFRLTNSNRTGEFVDLAHAAEVMRNSASNSSVSERGGDSSHLYNHNGAASEPSLPIKPKSTDANSLVLRSGTAANLRHRPYSVNHKTSAKSS